MAKEVVIVSDGVSPPSALEGRLEFGTLLDVPDSAIPSTQVTLSERVRRIRVTGRPRVCTPIRSQGGNP